MPAKPAYNLSTLEKLEETKTNLCTNHVQYKIYIYTLMDATSVRTTILPHYWRMVNTFWGMFSRLLVSTFESSRVSLVIFFVICVNRWWPCGIGRRRFYLVLPDMLLHSIFGVLPPYLLKCARGVHYFTGILKLISFFEYSGWCPFCITSAIFFCPLHCKCCR